MKAREEDFYWWEAQGSWYQGLLLLDKLQGTDTKNHKVKYGGEYGGYKSLIPILCHSWKQYQGGIVIPQALMWFWLRPQDHTRVHTVWGQFKPCLCITEKNSWVCSLDLKWTQLIILWTGRGRGPNQRPQWTRMVHQKQRECLYNVASEWLIYILVIPFKLYEFMQQWPIIFSL